MRRRLYILTGASGCGKSTVIRTVCTGDDPVGVIAPKYSTRPVRDDWDDIIPVAEIDGNSYDIAYVLNDRRYGLRTAEIRGLLEQQRDAFVVLSDLRVIRRMKQLFPRETTTLFISSPVDRRRVYAVHAGRHNFDPNGRQQAELSRRFRLLASAARLHDWEKVKRFLLDLQGQWSEMLPEADSANVRAEKIRTMHIRYVDNIDLFDHVLLNYTTIDCLTRQMRNVIASYLPQVTRKCARVAKAPLFVVAAASGAGKKTLMDVLNALGRDRIRIVAKMARRDIKPQDKDDGMIAIGKNGTFPDEFDLRWRFHEGPGFPGVEYAIRASEVEANALEGVPQIVISNMGQFGMFRKRFGAHAVFVYLHATRTEKDNAEYQYANCENSAEAERRIAEMAEVHTAYVDRIGEFDHVLLNTTYPEDMYDQMFQLLDAYGAGQNRSLANQDLP